MTGQTLPLQGDDRPDSGRTRKGTLKTEVGVSGTVTEISISENPKPCDRYW
jgi:hypothetical protein